MMIVGMIALDMDAISGRSQVKKIRPLGYHIKWSARQPRDQGAKMRYVQDACIDMSAARSMTT